MTMLSLRPSQRTKIVSIMEPVWPCIAVMIACVHGLPCNLGQDRLGNSCYQLLRDRMNWQQASQTCSDTCLGGGLAVPDFLDEHLFIWNMFKETGQDGNLWIGCHRERDKWVQDNRGGQECSYVKWARGEPLGGPGQNCLQMWVH